MVGTVYRSLVIGLLTAAVMLLARPWVVPSRSSGDNADRLAVVDVDRAAAGDHVLDLLGLAPGERVVAIDDRPGTTEDVATAWRAAAPGRFLDLDVAGPGGAFRRVLVLVHR